MAFGGPPFIASAGALQGFHCEPVGSSRVQHTSSLIDSGVAVGEARSGLILTRKKAAAAFASSASAFHGLHRSFIARPTPRSARLPSAPCPEAKLAPDDDEDEDIFADDEELPDPFDEGEGEGALLDFFSQAAEEEPAPRSVSPRPLASSPQPFFADFAGAADAVGPKPIQWWTTAIKRTGERSALEAMTTYRRMLDSGVEPDTITYYTLMDVLSDHGDVERMEGLAREMEEAGESLDAAMRLCFLRAYGRAGDLARAEEVFREMVEVGKARHEKGEFKDDPVAPGSLPRVYELYAVACTRCHRPDLALEAATELRALGFVPTSNTYSCVVRYYGGNGSPESAWDVMERSAAEGVEVSAGDITSVLCRFIRFEQPKAALERFARILGPTVVLPPPPPPAEGDVAGALAAAEAAAPFGADLPPSAVRITAEAANALAINLIRGVADIYGRDVDSAREVPRIMASRGVEPDEKTLTCLTTVLVECGAGQAAAEVVEEMQRRSLDSDTAYNIIALKLIKDYIRRRQLGGANRVIGEMLRSGRKPNAKTWTEVVVGCLVNRKPDMAGRVVADMREAGLKPDYGRIRAIMMTGELDDLKNFSERLRTDRVKRNLTAARIAAGGRRKAIYGENPGGRPGGELQMGQAGVREAIEALNVYRPPLRRTADLEQRGRGRGRGRGGRGGRGGMRGGRGGRFGERSFEDGFGGERSSRFDSPRGERFERGGRFGDFEGDRFDGDRFEGGRGRGGRFGRGRGGYDRPPRVGYGDSLEDAYGAPVARGRGRGRGRDRGRGGYGRGGYGRERDRGGYDRFDDFGDDFGGDSPAPAGRRGGSLRSVLGPEPGSTPPPAPSSPAERKLPPLGGEPVPGAGDLPFLF